MNALKIFKIGISVFVLTAQVLVLWHFNAADLQSDEFITNILLSTFWTFLLFTSLVYRIAVIGDKKFEWTPLLLFLIVLTLICIMHFFPKSTFSLWDIALIFFLGQVFHAFNRQLRGKGIFTLITKILIAVACILALTGALIKPETTAYYNYMKFTLMLTSLAVIVHYLIPKRKLD